MNHDAATREAIISSVFKGLNNGGALQPLLDCIGVHRFSFMSWLAESPELLAAYTRTRETWADKLVEECVAVSRDRDNFPDPKERRVIIDTNLRVAALYAPQRYSQAALDRLVAPEPEQEHVTPEEIATRIMRAMEVSARLALPAPADVEDGEFVDA